MSAFDFAGRTALVTGGAAGIGLAMTRRLVGRYGAHVVVLGRSADRLAAVRQELGQKVTPIQADLGDSARVDDLIAELPGLAPDLSLLINNAGVQQLTDFIRAPEAVDRDALRAEIAVNFTAVVALSTGLLPHLKAQPSAAIVNVTSGLALAPKKSSPLYCATKSGVRAFTRALRYQCEDACPHVQVTEALPPLVDTDMTRGRGRGKMSSDACAAEILNGVAAGRHEVHVGKAKILRTIMRVAPSLGYRIIRNG